MARTRTQVRFERVVDGDTIKVETSPGQLENLRILSLDTEESNASGGKPVTPHGHAAKEEAIRFFDGVEDVTIEFPGDEPVDEAFSKYRGTFGRPLVWVFRGESDGSLTDFQEHQIRQGFSPYFVKYGRAEFEDLDSRYRRAERAAQSNHAGVWDQVASNGSEINNYALLGTWWTLRARVIDEYRARRAAGAEVLNSRLDFARIEELAEQGSEATIFTELRDFTPVANHAIINIGSLAQPFQVFLPKVDEPDNTRTMQLLANRYMSGDSQHPRRGYAYVTGELQTFQGKPEIVVTSHDQITDRPPSESG